MSIDELAHLRSELPAVFADLSLPPEWDEDWLFMPIDGPEDPAPAVAESLAVGGRDTELSIVGGTALPPSSSELLADYAPMLVAAQPFPGLPARSEWNSPLPPPDAFAFYLPYHYYYATWWGIYIVLEYAIELAQFVVRESRSRLDLQEALTAVRIFLYAHEAFHHNVEAFATRLEVTSRQPMYVAGFQELFDRTRDSDLSIEELLATAYAYRRVAERFSKSDREKRNLALAALRTYIEQCPPGYRRAHEAFAASQFKAIQSEFAELNHNECFPNAPNKAPWLWSCFPHAFSGISRVTSRVNYVISRNSPLANRLGLNLRYLRYRELNDKLRRVAMCEPVRQGHGSHEIWRSPSGKRFPVPRHPGDLHRGLLAGIIKQAGLRMSLSEFLSA